MLWLPSSQPALALACLLPTCQPIATAHQNRGDLYSISTCLDEFTSEEVAPMRDAYIDLDAYEEAHFRQ
ncbi:hypothetical protein SNOG_14559 [Parastagonospora nodorum SN15]|uniref:Uncharacterized protein n=1 Tax=Phaeosphaeria nodorum (strain SN15 / ATCC MYA-4574 / FGSC 10173) TaxID=321614 RepID=Q0U146_PHANO|nr:hypothetical protein SNOG_14559 [Parastagonospora nodorum SN15]EAT78099.1 hypothetical protein SNOG_14559 [Parastagonospora nodorum SN15]